MTANPMTANFLLLFSVNFMAIGAFDEKHTRTLREKFRTAAEMHCGRIPRSIVVDEEV